MKKIKSALLAIAVWFVAQLVAIAAFPKLFGTSTDSETIMMTPISGLLMIALPIVITVLFYKKIANTSSRFHGNSNIDAEVQQRYKCSHCGTTQMSAGFCTECGKRISDEDLDISDAAQVTIQQKKNEHNPYSRNLTKCKSCGATIAKNAGTCPYCGAKHKQHTGLGIALIIIGAILFVGGISSISSGDAETQSARVQKEDTTISMSEFDEITTGMSYAQVCKIVGCEGTLMSEADIGDRAFKTQIYTWTGNGFTGSNANVTFQGNKVVAKSQLGLK